MTESVRVLLLYGGKTIEHEVSLVSAAGVLQNLDSKKYHIIPVAIDKKGCFHLHKYEDLLNFKDKLPVTTSCSEPLISFSAYGKCTIDADVLFPVVHGPLYEDGCLQGLLSLLDIAYVGCDVLSSSICMDKDISRRLACSNDLKRIPYSVLSLHYSEEKRRAICEDAVNTFGLPVFVKPCSSGSSVGIHKVDSLVDLAEAVNDAFRFDNTVLLEKRISGREVELAVLENKNGHQPMVSVAGEIRVQHPDGFYSYSAKYLDSEQTELIIPALMDNVLLSRLQQAAADVFEHLKCRGMARIDFFVDNEDIYFNEANTLPGFTPISMYPKLWQASGKNYSDLLDELVELALQNYKERLNIVTDYL